MKITPYLHYLINDHRIARGVWKIQINMHVNFISSRDTGKLLLIVYGMITLVLCKVETQMILLYKFLILFYITIKKS